MPTRHYFEAELATLRTEIMQMGELVAKAIEDSVTSLSSQDSQLAQQVIDNDVLVNNIELTIDEKCIILIAKQQPMARDLRVISTGMKIITDIERMGDHACDIASVTLRLANQPLMKPLVDIPRMSQLVMAMLRNSLEAYTNMDTVLAEKVCHDDDAIDALYNSIFRELLTYMMEDPRTISQATQLILVGRYLERIGDHATNIAEWVIYLATGQRMKHN